MRIGQRDFRPKGHTYVMGILNITPDSFRTAENLMSWIRHYIT